MVFLLVPSVLLLPLALQDVEPNTGVLVRAAKRLQLNYYMEDWFMPSTQASSTATLQSLCDTLVQNNSSNTTTAEICGLAKLFVCIESPSDWKFRGGGVYFPYAWTEEVSSSSSSMMMMMMLLIVTVIFIILLNRPIH